MGIKRKYLNLNPKIIGPTSFSSSPNAAASVDVEDDYMTLVFTIN